MGLFGNADNAEANDENENNKKAVLVLGIIALMVIILGVITYLFFYNQHEVAFENEVPVGFVQQSAPTPTMGDLDTTSTDVIQSTDSTSPIAESTQEVAIDSTPTSEVIAPQPTVAQTAPQPIVPQATPPVAVQTAPIATTPKPTSTIASLKYTIKPNNADIYLCDNMRIGKWRMPKKCDDEIIIAVQRLIDANNELIAIEVSGIVDGNPYSGPSAELKQEGLASFRAREGIIAIMRAYSNVAAFEGPSQQARGKRGFQVKAYYLQR